VLVITDFFVLVLDDFLLEYFYLAHREADACGIAAHHFHYFFFLLYNLAAKQLTHLL
jgi:hypothetical protein